MEERNSVENTIQEIHGENCDLFFYPRHTKLNKKQESYFDLRDKRVINKQTIKKDLSVAITIHFDDFLPMICNMAAISK